MSIPEKMTMAELRDFTVKNGLWYSHVYKNGGRVKIYRDRYKYPRDLIGETEVIDYSPIRNFKSMRSGSNYRTLQIIRKRIEIHGQGYRIDITKSEEIEVIKNWLEEKR